MKAASREKLTKGRAGAGRGGAIVNAWSGLAVRLVLVWTLSDGGIDGRVYLELRDMAASAVDGGGSDLTSYSPPDGGRFGLGSSRRTVPGSDIVAYTGGIHGSGPGSGSYTTPPVGAEYADSCTRRSHVSVNSNSWKWR